MEYQFELVVKIGSMVLKTGISITTSFPGSARS